jgi:drug/metabolite transporter (DMT)-like permease
MFANNKKNIKFGTFVFLHFIFLWISLAGIFAKLSSQEIPFSVNFWIYYIASLSVLVSYSFFWQLIIARTDISIAYANKGVVILWGLVWSIVFFGEKLTVNNFIGSSFIIVGIVVIVSKS